GTLTNVTGLPPVRRDVGLNTSQAPALAVFAQSALISKGWIDPSTPETNQIFQAMIESVISGKNEPANAVYEARQELDELLK
ncbi:hypothetical protein H7X87_04225, partial [Acetobacteraceae bacterium]|nr:hypothetical protein [Candidatus Parcubacteria bacterium]